MAAFKSVMAAFKIGVFASAAGEEVEKLSEQADLIGREVVHEGGILVTGACPGLPHRAALAAHYQGGIVLGYSPAVDLAEHVQRYKFPADPYILTFTGMGFKGRNLISTRTCDAAIYIAGRTGTLNEFTLVYDEGGENKAIGLLAGSGGVVDDHIIPILQTIDKPSKAQIIIAHDSRWLVQRIFEALRRKNNG